jgi:hypothetical protein
MMNLGRLLIMAGVALVIIGAIVLLAGKFNLPFGRLPGDIVYRGKNTTVYFPWVTCLVISVVLTLIMWIVNSRR